MMTLEEAIKHCHEKAEEIRKANEEMPTDCKLSEDLCECAREHEQLAEWLKDYKRLLESSRADWIIESQETSFDKIDSFKCSVCGWKVAEKKKDFVPIVVPG